MAYATPPRQASLPRQQTRITQFQEFIKQGFARVTKNDDFETKGKIEVEFLNRTKPAPIWVLDPSVGKPEVGDYVLVGFIDGQKNNPYMAGIVAHKAYTSNFIRVEKTGITIQFPLDETDVVGSGETDPKNHLRDDSKQSTRIYLKIDASGATLHVPGALPLNLQASAVNILNTNGTTRTTL